MERLPMYTVYTSRLQMRTEKSKITKILNPRKIQNGKFLIKWQNQKPKHIKQMNNNCHIPDLVQAFSDIQL